MSQLVEVFSLGTERIRVHPGTGALIYTTKRQGSPVRRLISEVEAVDRLGGLADEAVEELLDRIAAARAAPPPAAKRPAARHRPSAKG